MAASRLVNPKGIDRDIAQRQAAKMDDKRLTQAMSWIGTVSKCNMSGDFHADLKSGVVLCTLINAISPGAVKKFKNSKMPFVQRENISKYMKACKKLGMRESDVFVTDDLFEANDLSVVLMQIFALSKVSKQIRTFSGPYIETFQDGEIIPEQVSLVDKTSAAAPAPVPPPQPKKKAAAPPPQPKKKAAAPPPQPKKKATFAPPPAAKKAPPLPSRASISDSSTSTSPRSSNAGSAGKAPPKKRPRHLKSVLQKKENKDNPLVPKSDRKRGGGKMAEIERLVGGSSAGASKARTAPPPVPAAAKPRTNAPKPQQFKSRDDECVWWVQTVSGVPVQGGFQDGLKSGVALCTLVNTIAPGTIRKFRNKAKLSKFECLENIAAYIKGCRKLGVAEHELFVSNDLYEGNSLRQVANSIVAFSNISRDISSFNGPYIGIAVTKKNERQFTLEQKMKANSAIPFTSSGSLRTQPARKLDKIIRS